MIEYLQRTYGYTSTCLTVDEKNELQNLRIEVKKYRDLEYHHNNNDNESSFSDDSDDIDESLDHITPTKKLSFIPRSAVSAEVYGQYNLKENFKAREIPKNPETVRRIKSRILTTFLFGNLDPKDLDIVIGAMDEKKFTKGETVITQGENGDCLYLIECGELDCYKRIHNTEKCVKHYIQGDTFGELALLYNCPRAATVKAVTDVVTWCLDRETFNHIVKDAAQKKRERYESFLKTVNILSTIDSYELMQICDALKTETFKKGDYIIREGECGDLFYILEEGMCIATKALEPGKPAQEIKKYSEGEYFGERALIKGEPRYANIEVVSDIVKVISLDRNSFKRLLGPIEPLLKRNMEQYTKFITK
jgi:cAMP-dependent protein kinase regulator